LKIITKFTPIMMQKRIYAICLSLVMIGGFHQSQAQQGKAEVSLAYGYYSMFTLMQGAPFYVSTGTPNVNFRYYLNKMVTVGLGIGFENNSNWGSFLTFSPEMTFRYLDTKDNWIRVRLYGAVAYGLTVFNDNNNAINHDNQTGPKLWGFQGTPIGVRVGRRLAGFAELGFGYKGLINVGLSCRFRALPKKVILEH
jgi:hypothetical protein